MKQSRKAIAAEVTSRFIERLLEENKTWEADGKDAWTSLKRLGNDNLPNGDEVIIARRIYQEIQKLKIHLKEKGMGIGEFCIKADLGQEGDYSKELYRMMLAPDKDSAQVRLRKSAAKYCRLIAALGKQTRESTSSLANRLLIGTNLHPANAKDWADVERVQVALQAIVDEVDQKFSLYAKFMETAELKVAHVKAGGKLCWPHYDLDFNFYSDSEEGLREYRNRWNKASDTFFAYWENHNVVKRSDYFWWPIAEGSGCLQDTEFFYIPHAHLGHVEIFNLPDYDDDPIAHRKALEELVEHSRKFQEKYGWYPKDDWDEILQHPVGQADFDVHGTWENHGWIVIYPTPDNQRLMSMLYIPLAGIDAYLLPLDAGNLNFLRKAYFIGQHELSSVFEKIKKLIGYREETSPTLRESFHRTAPWFDHNPFFKLKREMEYDGRLLEEFCRQFWPNRNT